MNDVVPLPENHGASAAPHAAREMGGAVSVQREGDCVRVTGPLTMMTVPSAAREGEGALADGVQCVDVSAVTEVDSAAVALLLEWARRVGPSLRIHGASDPLRNLVKLYSIDEFLPLAAAAQPSP